MSEKNKEIDNVERLHAEYTSRFGSFLYDPKVISQYQNISGILQNISSISPKDTDSAAKAKPSATASDIRSVVEKSIINQLMALAQIQYLLMERTNNYGLLGEQRVSISFCRLLKNITPDREVTQFDADSFRQDVLKARQQINHLSVQQLQDRVKTFELNILGQKHSSQDMTSINRALKVLESTKKYFSNFDQGFVDFLFGDAKVKKMKKYTIYIFDNEVARSPISPLSVVAGNSKNNINIRRVCCETIFYNKWQRVLQYSDSETRRLMESNNNNICETIKQKALALYNVGDADTLSQSKKLFVDEIIEGVLWHEVGHTIISEYVHPPKYFALNKVFYSYKDDFCTVLEELFADWAPAHGKIQGPIDFFINLADKGGNEISKAQRMLCVYFSDNWFLSHDDTDGLLPSQTDILVSILLPYMSKSGCDFSRLKKDKSALFEKIFNLYQQAMDHILNSLQGAVFVKDGKKMSFSEASNAIKEIIEHPICKDEWSKGGEKSYEIYYWSNVMRWSKQYSPECFKNIEKLMDEALVKFRQDLLTLLIGPDQAATYNHNLRTYLIERMKELGFYTPVEPISNREAIEMASEETYIPFGERNSVLEWFSKILGESLTDSPSAIRHPASDGTSPLSATPVSLAISYDEEPAYPIMVLQEMLVRSNVGKIMDGMSCEISNTKFDVKSMQSQERVIELKLEDKVAIPMTEKDKENEQQLRDQLVKLKDRLDNREFLRIKNLKFNLRFGSEAKIKELAEGITLASGLSLSHKIQAYEAAMLSPQRVFEIYLPLERGYFCWNTVQAIWRINQQLRQTDTKNEWTLDKLVLEKIIKGYLNSY